MIKWKVFVCFFTFHSILFWVSQNVHASSPSYDVLTMVKLTLDTWDDATYEEELVYYFWGDL